VACHSFPIRPAPGPTRVKSPSSVRLKVRAVAPRRPLEPHAQRGYCFSSRSSEPKASLIRRFCHGVHESISLAGPRPTPLSAAMVSGQVSWLLDETSRPRPRSSCESAARGRMPVRMNARPRAPFPDFFQPLRRRPARQEASGLGSSIPRPRHLTIANPDRRGERMHSLEPPIREKYNRISERRRNAGLSLRCPSRSAVRRLDSCSSKQVSILQGTPMSGSDRSPVDPVMRGVKIGALCAVTVPILTVAICGVLFPDNDDFGKPHPVNLMLTTMVVSISLLPFGIWIGAIVGDTLKHWRDKGGLQ
jgi:hypothetical protein